MRKAYVELRWNWTPVTGKEEEFSQHFRNPVKSRGKELSVGLYPVVQLFATMWHP